MNKVRAIDQNYLVFLKVYLILKQVAKDGSCSYCDREIKELYVNTVLFLAQMTIRITSSGKLFINLSWSFIYGGYGALHPFSPPKQMSPPAVWLDPLQLKYILISPP